jgi:hypothetical protein
MFVIVNMQAIFRKEIVDVISLHPEERGRKTPRNAGILPQKSTASQPKRPRLEISPL